MQESGEASTQVAALEAIGTEQLANNDALESIEPDLLDENRRLDYQLIMARVEKERHKAQDLESMKALSDAKVEPANAKEALGVLETQASTDRSVMCSAIEGRDRMQGKLATTSAKLQVANGAFTSTFDHLK